MRHFDEIFAIAAARHGGTAALEAQLSAPLSPAALAAIPEDRWLAQFTKCMFQAGFNWKVVDAMWEGFEAAFLGFDPGAITFMDGATFDALIADKRIVRHGPKIEAVRANAGFVMDLRADGGIGKIIAQWPNEDYVGLLAMLKSGGARLGGNTGQYALRFMGRDGFILSRDVVARLVAEGVIDKVPTSKGALGKTQAAFNTWAAQSGRGLTQISQILARSAG